MSAKLEKHSKIGFLATVRNLRGKIQNECQLYSPSRNMGSSISK